MVPGGAAKSAVAFKKRLMSTRSVVPPSHSTVKSRDILYILSLDILYIGGEELGLGIQRSMIFERWIPGSSSRIRVVQ